MRWTRSLWGPCWLQPSSHICLQPLKTGEDTVWRHGCLDLDCRVNILLIILHYLFILLRQPISSWTCQLLCKQPTFRGSSDVHLDPNLLCSALKPCVSLHAASCSNLKCNIRLNGWIVTGCQCQVTVVLWNEVVSLSVCACLCFRVWPAVLPVLWEWTVDLEESRAPVWWPLHGERTCHTTG